MDAIITASAGQGLVDKLAQRGVQLVVCSKRDPRKAVRGFLTGVTNPVISYDHTVPTQHKSVPGERGCVLI